MLAYAVAPRNHARLEPRNRLLVALPPEDLRRLTPHLEPVTLPQRKVLFEPDEPLTRIYLIETAVVSLVTSSRIGTTVEMASVGREAWSRSGALLRGDSALGCYRRDLAPCPSVW